nr:MAG TPA: hypothetical protein [Caudoviricetes sp.]
MVLIGSRVYLWSEKLGFLFVIMFCSYYNT